MKNNPLEKFSNFVIFQTAKGKVNIDVFFQNDTLWLTQKKIGELFEKGRTTITEHLKNIFSENELDANSVCRDFRHTAKDGKNYKTKYDEYRVTQDINYISDFDREVKKLQNNND
jgi:phage regulator Rha-like protein